MDWLPIYYFSLALLIAVIIFFVFLNKKKNQWLEKENKLLMRQQKFYESHYQVLENTVKVYRHLKHDINNHIAVIQRLAEETDNSELKEYHKQLTDKSKSMFRIKYTAYPAVDAVLYNKIKICKDENININIDINHFDIGKLDITDVVILLFNLLDNSIESCLRIENPSPRYIYFNADVISGHLTIKVSNSVSKSFSKKTAFKTQKKDAKNHGFGLRIIHDTVDKYGGDILYEIENNQFESFISLNIH